MPYEAAAYKADLPCKADPAQPRATAAAEELNDVLVARREKKNLRTAGRTTVVSIH